MPEVFAVGAFGERQTIVMEYCPGPTLGMPLREQPRRAEVCLAELVAVQRRVHACSVPGLEPLQARLERKLQAAPLTPPFEPCITGGPKLCPAPLAFAMGIAGPLTSSKRKPLPSSSTGRRLRWSPCADACCSYPLFCARSGAGRADLRLYGQAGGLPHSDFLPRLSVVAAARLAEIPAGAGAEQLRAL